MRISFRLKLIFSYIIIILTSFTFIAFFLDRSLEENSLHNIRSSLVSQAGLIAGQISPDDIKKENYKYLEKLINNLGMKTKCRITVINSRGRVLADSKRSAEEVLGMEEHGYRPEVRAALAGNTGSDIRYSPTIKIDMLYVALPLMDNNGIIGVLRLALTLESVHKTLFEIKKIVFFSLLFALILAFILGSIMAAGTIKSVNNMIKVSRKFSQGDFSKRILCRSGDEVEELALTLNRMAEDIENKIGEIRIQNQKLAAIFNSMIEGIILVDKEGRIVSINPAAEKMFDITKKDGKGRLFLDAIRNTDMSELINTALKNERSVWSDITIIYPVHRVFEISINPIFEKNAINGCLAVIHDATEIKRLETIRSDFVANVSHELKTPLTSIKGFVETLLEGALDDKENNRKFLKIINDHVQRLDSLVNDLLTLSHLESKEIAIKKSAILFRPQVEEIISGFKSQLEKKEITIKNELLSDIEVEADKDRIEQVLTNLIDNAIKFNKKKGAIRIYANETNNDVKITVEDSGSGIPIKDINRIFERFYRVDKARSRELGGTGLGLSIVKHIIGLHGGKVGVESIEGFGSKFWFTLPK